jgi:hypothetical protein
MSSKLDFKKYYEHFRGLTSPVTSHDSPLEKKVLVDHILGGAQDGSNGNDGSSYGGNGSNGSNGTSASNIFLRLSGNSTQFRITGTVQKIWDLSEDGYINLYACGGDGGNGGDGHEGRPGTDGNLGYAGKDGAAGCPGRDGTNGGPGSNGTDGGPGGHGANGGNGGLIVVESTNPWLFLFVQAKAVKGKCGQAGQGGSGSAGGSGGAGGPGGCGGTGLSRSHYVSHGNGQGETKTDYYPSGSSGHDGTRGRDGCSGSDGHSGSAGRNGQDGSILFSHIDEHGNILQISTNPFDLVLHHF